MFAWCSGARRALDERPHEMDDSAKAVQRTLESVAAKWSARRVPAVAERRGDRGARGFTPRAERGGLGGARSPPTRSIDRDRVAELETDEYAILVDVVSGDGARAGGDRAVRALAEIRVAGDRGHVAVDLVPALERQREGIDVDAVADRARRARVPRDQL